MPELVRKSVGLPWICAWGGGDRSVELKHKLMLGMIGATLGVLLQGCTANKPPSEGETSLANAAKDVVIPLEAGKMTNPLPATDEVVSQGQEVFLGSCAQCRGADARGDTSIGRSMYPPAMDLHSAHVQHWSDGNCSGSYVRSLRSSGIL
ncbi:MAG TPA: hypothetical protein VK813_03120 [Edaphobacter sp.]|jgi:mono/diheme cytochrome c family protein|nr:hypothetical protein [Edaphobacter sp.]